MGTWQRLPAAPIPAGFYEFAGVWTGRELLLYGAVQEPIGTPHAAGAAYNPATITWRKLPLPRARRGHGGGYTGVWTGTELLGGGLGLNAAHNPATNRWRRLPAMLTGRAEHTAVWADRRLLVWGGRTSRRTPPYGVADDPAGNRWSVLPESVLRDRTGHVAVWIGIQMLVWGGTPVSGGGSAGDGAAYTPSPL